jgi:SAM-dependent methyltransferase
VILERVTQVIRDRGNKQAMAGAAYWDARARSRTGFARSVWHSEAFSRVWDARQQEMLRAELGSLDGRRVADVGCGTGRISRFLAHEGAQVTGYDFSPATVEAAREEAREAGVSVTFEVADATTGTLPAEEGTFDISLAVGCLAVACRDQASLGRGLAAMSRATKVGGSVVLFEPIHRGKLLGRVLRASVGDWVATARREGLELISNRGMGFVPARLLLSSLDLPAGVVEGVFDAGEAIIDGAPWLEGLASDYRLLRFSRQAR